MPRHAIDPIIPIRIFEKQEDQILSQLIDLRSRYGFRRFVLLAPDKTIRFTGLPGIEFYEEIGRRVRRMKTALAPHDIEVGWECSATMKHGPGGDFQQITGLDGRTSEISYCPLDTGFQAYLTESIATVVSIARPFMVVLEDDYTLRHAGGVGCSCPLHLAAFAQRQNRAWSRDELRECFTTKAPETLPLRRAWVDLCRDTLVDLATLIRRSVDAIAPDTRLLLCQAGAADLEGNFTEAVTRALAGNTRPAVRLFGVDYGSDAAQSLPQVLFHALHDVQHLPDDFELFHESDTFPHTRFFASSAKLRSVMTAAFAYGMVDARFHPTQNTDNPLEDAGYAEMFRNESRRFASLKAAVADCHVAGCEVVYDPAEHLVESTRRYAWANVLGRLGIPHTAAGGNVKMVSGNTVQVMSDQQIRSLLEGNVFLDGKAALQLGERGFADLIGAAVAPGQTPHFLYETIRETAGLENVSGRITYNFQFFGSVGPEGGDHVRLHPHDDAEVLTDFTIDGEQPVTPGMIRFENHLGGRVAITAYDLNNNGSSGVINYKKKELLRQTLEWLGREPLPLFVRDLPNVFPIFNLSTTDNTAVVVLINLCSDTFPTLPLDLAPQWQHATIEQLDADGNWQRAAVERTTRTVRVNHPLALFDPLILRLKQD